MDERLVEIQNVTNGELVYRIPSLRVRRAFLPNMKMKVSFDELREALCDYGIRFMFEKGYLVCTAHEDAVDLEIVEADKKLSGASEVEAILKSGKSNEIYVLMKNANKSTQDIIINCLVNNQIFDSNIVKWCKDFFNYDLLTVMSKISE